MDVDDFATEMGDADRAIEELGQQAAHLTGLLSGLVRFQPAEQEEAEKGLRRVRAIIVIVDGLSAAARSAQKFLGDGDFL